MFHHIPQFFSYSYPLVIPFTPSLQFNHLYFRRLRLHIRITPTPVPLLMLKLRHLLRVHLPLLQPYRLPRNNARLPRQRPYILGPQRIRKHILHLLQRLARRLRKRKQHMHKHCEAKDAKDDIRLPFDVDKSGRNKVSERKVKGPVRRRGERDRLAADAQRVQFRRVDPGDGAPGRRVGRDEEIGAGDDGLGRGAADGPGGFGRVVDAVGPGVVAVGFQQAAVGEHPGHHAEGAEEEGGAAAPAVDEEEGGDREEDVDDVLDAGGEEEVVALQAGHGEDVGYVVHHYVHSW